MIRVVRLILRLLPWILLVIALIWIIFTEKPFIETIPGNNSIVHETLLERAEKIGKLELVKYHFKEITEITREAEKIRLFSFEYKMQADAKALLISTGEAVGCIDLTRIRPQDINFKNDTIYIQLPHPELCYFKIDLNNSRIYSLQTGFLSANEKEKTEFIEELYAEAESQIRKAALSTDILEEAYVNAEAILEPIFNSISQKAVVFTKSPPSEKIDAD